jgi:hypothetical protein
MWQDLYDEKYLEWIDEAKDATIDLVPFHMDEHGKSYNSITCSFPRKTLGYTYPELQIWLEEYKTDGNFDKVKFRKMLKEGIDTKYGTTAKSVLQLADNERTAKVVISNMTTETLSIAHFPPPLLAEAEELKSDKQSPPGIGPDGETWDANDYVVNVVYDR